MRIHTGENQFAFAQCGNSFIYKGHLNDYMRIHTGENPFAFAQCGNSFIYKGHLNTWEFTLEKTRLHSLSVERDSGA